MVLDLPLGSLRYFHTYHNPNGGRNKHTAYTTICLESDVSGGFLLMDLPQFAQKKAVAEVAAWHEGQLI
jgi:hypothetical protein